MKKNILSITAILFGMLTAFADNISVPDVTITPGETATVGISLTNTELNLVSFQMDLTLPEGITVNKAGCSLTSRFTDEDQELTIGKQSANVYRLTSTSFALTPISGTSGEIITLSLTASANSEGGTATLSNIRFVTSGSDKLTLDDASFSITVSAPSPAITFADANVKALCVANWDTNQDGELSEAEAAAVLNLNKVFYNNKNITFFNELQYFTGLTSIGYEEFCYCRNLASVTIPNNVTTIGDFAFEGCHSLSAIDIPNGVASIGRQAFNYCNLTSITIPQSVTLMTENPFFQNDIVSITVSGDNTKYDSRNNCNAIIETETNILIAGCKETVFPNNISSIGNRAFLGCKGLTSVSIPDGVESIGIAAFADCMDLASVTIPSSVTTIGSMAFYMDNINGYLPYASYCSLTSVKVEREAPIAIDEYTFFNRANATLYVPFGSKAAYEAADYWKEFKEIMETESVDIILNGNLEGDDLKCFYSRENYSENDAIVPATIIDGAGVDGSRGIVVQSIDNPSAHYDTQFFVRLPQALPAGTKYCISFDYKASQETAGSTEMHAEPSNYIESGIGTINYTTEWQHFEYCGTVSEVQSPADTPMRTITFNLSEIQTSTTYYFDNFAFEIDQSHYTGDIDIYFKDENVKTLCLANWDTNQNGELSEAEAAAVTSLGEVFKENTNITSFDELQYFTGLTSIGDYAFYNCTGLTSIVIPNCVTSIGIYAFFYCSSLTSVTIPSSVTSIGYGAFAGCSGLSSIVVEAGNNVYDSREECNAIIKTNNNELIAGCKNTTIPNSVTSIDGYAFRYCSSLTSITIPEGVTTIGEGAFISCTELVSANIPSGVERIEGTLFRYCEKLASITISEGVTFIGWCAFEGCSSLTTICLPQSVTTIDDYAFWYCNFTSVEARMKSPVSIEEHVFPCRTNATLFVPAGSKAAYEAADYWKEFKEIVEMPAPLADIEEDIYCLKNVETGKYLNAGNAWGTHAVLADEPLPARISKQPDGSYTIFFPVGSKSQQLLFRDDETNVYVDYNETVAPQCPYWTITDVGNGNYHIQSLITHETYGQEALPGTYLGNNPTKEATNQNGDALGIYNDVDGNVLNEEGMNITWTLETVPAPTAAQVSRLQGLVATAQGLGLDTSEAEAVLNNSEATYIDFLGTIINLQTRINEKIEENDRINKKVADLTMLIACANAVGVNTDAAQAVVDNPSGMDALVNAINTLRETYIAELGEGVSSSLLPIDVTGVILNPSFVLDNADNWSCDNETPQFQSYNNAEYYQKAFDIHQTISGLPNGNFVLKVKGFHRPGGDQDVYSAYQQGIDNASAELYANGEAVILKNQATGAQETQLIDEYDAWRSVTYDNVTKYVPGSMHGARSAFDAGLYENELPFTVTDGTLTLGIRLDESVDGGWVIFDDFRLEYQGKEENNEVEVTDITQLSDAIYIKPFTACFGSDVQMGVCLKNSQAATAYIFDLVLPAGVTVAKNEQGKFIDALSDRHSDHTRTFNDKGNNTYSLSTLSGNSEALIGNDGAIRVLTLHVADDVAKGEYAIEIKNASYSLLDGQNVELPNTTSAITISDFVLGDVNGNNGVDIGDAVSIVNYLVGKPSATFMLKAADTNKNGGLDIGDAVTIVNFLVGKSVSLSRQTDMEIDEREPQ